jgi:hypothetical protein
MWLPGRRKSAIDQRVPAVQLLPEQEAESRLSEREHHVDRGDDSDRTDGRHVERITREEPGCGLTGIGGSANLRSTPRDTTRRVPATEAAGVAFYTFGLILLPTLAFVGLATFHRVLRSGIAFDLVLCQRC